jgi:glycosyltransferase involved in cell wall biosynthesis
MRVKVEGKSKNNLTIGFYYHDVFLNNNENEYYVPSYLGLFLDSLAERCDKLICFLHPEHTCVECDYQIRCKNIKIVSLGKKSSAPNRWLFAHGIIKPLSKEMGNIDIMLIRGPSVLLPSIAKAARKSSVALMIVGNQLSSIDSLPQRWWRKKLIRFMWKWNKIKQDGIMSRALVIVNSKALFREYEGKAEVLREIRTSTLSLTDIYERDNTCNNEAIRVLYVGRYDAAKGLLDLLEAFYMLRRKGYPVLLELAGWSQKADLVMERFEERALQLGLSPYIKDHGYLKIGHELFELYKRSDIYVLPSHHESFPRTIWEAMAHSLPVVATKVGSIPDYLVSGEDAIIVPPKDPESLCEGIASLINDKQLRSKLIRNGLKLAKNNTIDLASDALIDAIQNYLEKKT